NRGLPELHRLLRAGVPPAPAPRRDLLSPEAEAALDALAQVLAKTRGLEPEAAQARGVGLLTVEARPEEAALVRAVGAARSPFEALGIDPTDALVEARYAWIARVHRQVVAAEEVGPTLTERVDRLVTHRVWGLLIFLALMALVFQAIM